MVASVGSPQLDEEIKKVFLSESTEKVLKFFSRQGKASSHDEEFSKKEQKLKKIIQDEAGEDILRFITEQAPLNSDRTILLLSSTDITYEVSLSNSSQIKTVIDLGVINYKNDLNTYFPLVNSVLPDAGIYIGCVETTKHRWIRFSKGHRWISAKVMWMFDFMVNRVFARLSFTKSVYSLLSRNRYFVVSKAEVLGRLSHAGFEIIGYEEANNLMYFSAMKTGFPSKKKNVPDGLLLKMRRVSKGGKMIGIYKVRTMHPYSEYIQDYVVKMNGYNDVGKPNYDFRITSWGKLIRKLHIDEIPQLINVLKGELAIVGVRPLTQFGFKSLPEDLQKERIKYRPGCIPPNVALGLTGFDGVVRAERIYLHSRKKYGVLVNFKYFWMAIYNMVTKRKLSA